jgi:hypothetical protein
MILISNLWRVILLDSFVSTDYTSRQWGDDPRPPFLRVLQTSVTTKVMDQTTTNERLIPSFVIVKIPDTNPYEAPNLVKDLAAALLAHVSVPCLCWWIYVFILFYSFSSVKSMVSPAMVSLVYRNHSWVNISSHKIHVPLIRKVSTNWASNYLSTTPSWNKSLNKVVWTNIIIAYIYSPPPSL